LGSLGVFTSVKPFWVFPEMHALPDGRGLAARCQRNGKMELCCCEVQLRGWVLL